MKELLRMAFRFDVPGLLWKRPPANVVVQTFRALFVGGVAFIADAGLMWLLALAGIHYAVSIVFGFVLGVAVNYLLSVAIVFTGKAKVGKTAEISFYLVLALIGLGLTELIVWLLHDVLPLHLLAAKGIATIIVFMWNFTARKLLLYKDKLGG